MIILRDQCLFSLSITPSFSSNYGKVLQRAFKTRKTFSKLYFVHMFILHVKMYERNYAYKDVGYRKLEYIKYI